MRIVEAASAIEAAVRAGAYRPEISIARDALQRASEILVTPGEAHLLAHGTAGSGKTTWACQLAQHRIDQGAAVVFVETLPGGESRAGELLDLLAPRIAESSDERLVILFDDVAGRPPHAANLSAAIDFARHAIARPRVRLLFFLRTETLNRFEEVRTELLQSRRFRDIELESFRLHELLALSQRLPVPSDADATQVLEARRRAAVNLADSTDVASLIPSLAVSFLESVDGDTGRAGVSRFRVYSRLYAGRVLHDMQPIDSAAVRKSRLLKELARELLRSQKLSVRIDSPTNLPLFNAAGDLLDEYRVLVADRILQHSIGDLAIAASFSDDDFLAFVLAAACEPEPSAVSELLAASERFTPAHRAAAFLVARIVSRDRAAIPDLYARLQEASATNLLSAVGDVDAETFLAFLPTVIRDDEETAARLLGDLLSAGFPRLAARSAEIFLGLVSDGRKNTIRGLLAQALYDIDDLAAAARVLDEMTDSPTIDRLNLMGEIAIARGYFDDAKRYYSEILTRPGLRDDERACALHGLGDVTATAGDVAEGERMLREAIALYRRFEPSKDLAEAYGDLGEALAKEGRLVEAREAIDASAAINAELPSFYAGLMINEGLYGMIDARAGQLDSAEKRLTTCLDAARKLNFVWREAWCLQHLATVANARGDAAKAATLQSESACLFARLADGR